MSYILKNNSGLVTVRLTDAGRKKLSQGNLSLSLFQLGDSEFCYDCYTDVCSAQNIARTDLENWKAAIRARENTGSLDEATVCINITPVANTAGMGFDVSVIVSWRGRQDFKASDATKDIQCGNVDDRRRLVKLDSYLLIRG